MSELSEGAQSLIEQGRAGDAPSARDKQRIRGRLTAELGAGAFVTAALSAALPAAGTGSSVAAGMAGTTAAATQTTASSSSAVGATWAQAGSRAAAGMGRTTLWQHGVVKLLAAAGSAAALVLGVVTLRPHENPQPKRTPQAVTAPAPLVAVERAAPEIDEQTLSKHSDERAEVPADVAKDTALSRSPTHARKRAAHGAAATIRGEVAGDSQASLSAELALLASAQRALREGAPDLALRLAGEHAARFSHGALAEERRGIEALAHCQRGEPGDPSVQKFLSESGRTPLAARVRKQCGAP